jgi:hypothetical protein
MSRKWCIVVRPADTASSVQIGALGDTFAAAGDRLEWRREGLDWHVYADELDDQNHGEPAITQMLSEAELTSTVVIPFPIGIWYESLGRYVISASSDDQLDQAAVPTNEITWVVSVRPVSAFDWKAMRAELAQRSRISIGEGNDAVEVGATDESDADELVAELIALPSIASATARPLSKLGRWKVREHMQGNYRGPLDGLFDGTPW